MYIFKKFLLLNLIFPFKKYLLIIFLIFPQIEVKSNNNFIEKEQNSEKVSENFEALNKELLNYRLGAGDEIFININNISYLTGKRIIGPDGYLFLPEINSLKVSGLTIQGLKEKLDFKYKTFVKKPNSQILISAFRPVRFYIHGEVKKPGYYSVQQPLPSSEYIINSNKIEDNDTTTGESEIVTFPNESSPTFSYTNFPTVFDAIKISRGITPYSKLNNVNLIRTIPNKKGEETKYKAELNFLSMIMEGDQSQNMRILDGDIIFIERSDIILKEQFAKARNSNLTPDNINIYVSGNVLSNGLKTVPKGSGLNQALAMAGGQRVFSGNVEFLRFNDYGETIRSSFKYSSNARINTKRNPILMDGDIIHVNESLLAKSAKVITIIADPVLRSYGLYSLFD
tara:strand:+ start:7114 stop:8307 length:1194 start_codon:yes stop_codon:yes gene_type:complete